MKDTIIKGAMSIMTYDFIVYKTKDEKIEKVLATFISYHDATEYAKNQAQWNRWNEAIVLYDMSNEEVMRVWEA